MNPKQMMDSTALRLDNIGKGHIKELNEGRIKKLSENI